MKPSDAPKDEAPHASLGSNAKGETPKEPLDSNVNDVKPKDSLNSSDALKLNAIDRKPRDLLISSLHANVNGKSCNVSRPPREGPSLSHLAAGSTHRKSRKSALRACLSEGNG